jgi:hypothetical protein
MLAIEKAFDKCEDSINCMNQDGGSKIITKINFEIQRQRR